MKLSDPGGGIRYGVEPVSAVGNDVRKLLNIARLASLSIDAAGNESYNFANYKFYTDYEGKYLGAERSFGSTFLYGTYLDYDQKGCWSRG